jgi:hypothetical protein
VPRRALHTCLSVSRHRTACKARWNHHRLPSVVLRRLCGAALVSLCLRLADACNRPRASTRSRAWARLPWPLVRG